MFALALSACSAVQTANAPAIQRASANVGFTAPIVHAAQHVAQATGIDPAYVSTYVGPGSVFPYDWGKLAIADNAILVVNIDTGSDSLQSVAQGSEDSWLASFAKSASQYKGTLAISIDHEFNGPWWPWSFNHQTPSSFKSAWHRIVNLFRSLGVHASWVWTVSNVDGKDSADISQYWPGSDYVDWIGLDAYYYSPKDTFANTFAPTIARAQAISDKSVLITETGALPSAGRVKDINDLIQGERRNPSIIGLIWFDYDKPSAHGPDHDWKIDSDAAAISALRSDDKS